MVERYKPHAITLDLHLPDGEGWHVLEHLKSTPATRHIPVHMITVDEERERGLLQGALAFLTKPVTKEALDAALADLKRFVRRRVKKLLVVGDDAAPRDTIIELIGKGDVRTTAVANGAEALAALKAERFDCMVLDLSLSDMTGFQLIEQLKKEPSLKSLPIIVYTGRDLTRKEASHLKRVAESIIVKGVQSPERLLDETSLYLHRVSANLPANQRKMLEQLHHPDASLAGKKVLLVDDDIRNLFAMTSVLERFNMNVLTAETGHDAIALLKRTRDIDIVLLDIMMPDMDGFDTLTAIRGIPRLKSLPIIVVTAKAMKGDREKCLEAGASDYLAKPVNTEQLLSALRIWLHR
jgi:CheY-like chemotaxis protein